MGRERMKEPLMQTSVDAEQLLQGDDISGAVIDSSDAVTTVSVLATAITVLGSFTCGFAIAFSSSAESGIIEDFALNLADYSAFTALMVVGGMIGALICGKLGDFIGRRGTMCFSETFSIIGWLTIILAKGAWWLYVGRLSLGFGLGIHCYMGPVYIGEIAPKSIRGGCTVANQLVATVGLSIMYFFGNLITWRNQAVIGIIPCVAHLIGIFFTPESPRWLAKIGQEKKFEATLQYLRGENADISHEAAEIRGYIKNPEHHQESRFWELFQRKYAYALTLAVGVTIMVQFGGPYAISSYASSIFEAAGCSTTLGTTMLAIIQLPLSALGVVLMDKSGRRPLWMVSAAGACLGNILLGLAFLLQDLNQDKDLIAILGLSGVLIFSSFFSIGLSSTQWIIMSEVLPGDVKGSAGSLISLINWISSCIITYTFNFAFEWSSTGTFFFFACICGMLCLFVGKMMPETKGRTLEEIQAAMSSDLLQ